MSNIFYRLYLETENNINNVDSNRKDNHLLVVLYKFSTSTHNN